MGCSICKGSSGVGLSLSAVLQALIRFHGTEFAVHLSTVKGETLKVLVERQEDASRWQGEFSAKRKHSDLDSEGTLPCPPTCLRNAYYCF